ncbi:unnamed protein product [Cuscuta epithymum]|uniref:Ubiquitin-like domain-containing protein n=1 Tax=Cuscuta epithymum TaxID=186058 RepID=A0AAV0EVV9_9ASTE|nr:unnamed protein product [Cuscuta epithymum]
MQPYGAKTFKESPRVSLSCPVPFSPRKSSPYNKLPQVPIKLTVLKLDGTSFEIYVMRNGTVAELKLGVEAAFSHVPKNGPDAISWPHVWARFCLSYEGEKLLTDIDSIENYGIRDGDQLEFMRHVSIAYAAKKPKSSPKRVGIYLDEPSESRGNGDRKSKYKEEKNNMGKLASKRVSVACHCQCRPIMWLKKWFSYHRVSRSVVAPKHPWINFRKGWKKDGFPLLEK